MQPVDEKVPSADSLPGSAFQADAIRQSYARKLARSISLLRRNLLVQRIGSSSHPQAGVETLRELDNQLAANV